MKIVFFGTSRFALPSLRKLAESDHQVLLVVTQPDRKKGRHLHLTSPPVKIEAQKLNIPIEQPEVLSQPDVINLLKSKFADLFVVVAFGQILKSELLQLPRQYCINLHASLLPKYRGAAPVNWAIIKGERAAGVSVIRMTEKMDDGDIMLTETIKIVDEDTSLTLNKKLSEIGAVLLLDVVDLIEKGEVKFIKQDEKLASFAPKLKKEDGIIDWKKPAKGLHNLVRGLIPWPAAFTYWKGKSVKIWKTGIDTHDFKFRPGEVAALEDKGIIVKTTKDNLIIKELQLEGGKRMDASAFLRGHKIKLGDKLG